MDHILETTTKNVQKSHFQCIFNDFGFLTDITPNVTSRSLIFNVIFNVGRTWTKEEMITFWGRSGDFSWYKNTETFENTLAEICTLRVLSSLDYYFFSFWAFSPNVPKCFIYVLCFLLCSRLESDFMTEIKRFKSSIEIKIELHIPQIATVYNIITRHVLLNNSDFNSVIL